MDKRLHHPISLVVKSGKDTLGYKSALKQMRNGKGLSNSVVLRLGLEPEAEKVPMLICSLFSMSLCSQLVLIAGHFPPLRESEIEYYYAMLSKIVVHHFAGMDVALGKAAGKLFRVGCVPSYLLIDTSHR
jgi:ribosomal protein L30E